MQHFINRLLNRARSDERGNVFILFAACAIPLLLVMGGAIDFARYQRYKVELSNAVGAASLALARQHPDYTAEQARTFVTNYVGAMNLTNAQFAVQSFDAQKN